MSKFIVKGSDKETIDGFIDFIKQIQQTNQPQYSGDANYYKDMYNEGNEVNGDQTGLLSWWNSKTGRGLTSAQRQSNAFSAWQSQVARDYSTEMANTQWQRGVTDMQNAGVNPALIYGNGGSPNGIPSTAEATSVNPGAPTMGFQDIISLMKLPAEIKLLEAQAKKTDAEGEVKEAEVPYADEYFDLRNQGMNLVNKKTKADTDNAIELKNQIIEQTNLIAKQVKTEEERKLSVIAETALKKAQENQIVELLPFNKNLMEAQTEEANDRATLAWWQAVYQQGLVDSGYIENLNKEINARAYQAYQAGECSKAEAEQAAEKTKGIIFGNKLDGADDLFDSSTGVGRAGNFVVKGLRFVERWKGLSPVPDLNSASGVAAKAVGGAM